MCNCLTNKSCRSVADVNFNNVSQQHSTEFHRIIISLLDVKKRVCGKSLWLGEMLAYLYGVKISSLHVITINFGAISRNSIWILRMLSKNLKRKFSQNKFF